MTSLKCAAGVGLSYKLNDKWSVRGDVWYAQLAETPEDADDDYLGEFCCKNV